MSTEKIQQYNALRPIRFGLLSRFEWVTAPLPSGYSYHLLLRLTSLQDPQRNAELVLNFEGVRNMRFTTVGLAQPVLEISDVTNQQWDRVRYEVRDRENDTIYFLCSDFSALLQETSA